MTPIDYLLSTLVSALWGGNFVASKIALAHYSPLFMSTLRFAMVALLLVPFVERPTGRWKEVTGVAITLGTLHFSLVFIGIDMGLDVTTSVITAQMGVPFSCLLGTIFLKDRLGPIRSTGLLVAFVGLVLVAGTPRVEENWIAFLLVLGGAFFWSVSNIQMKRMQGVSILSLIGWAAAISTPQLFILSLIFEEQHWQQLTTSGMEENLAVLYSVLGSTLLAYGTWYHLLAKHDVSQVVPFSLLIPFFGVSFGVVMLGEALTTELLIGGAVTLAGVAIIVLRKPRTNKAGNTA